MSSIGLRKVTDIFRKVSLPEKTRFTMEEVKAFNAHGWFCHYCQSTENLSSDHIIPQSMGGSHHAENLIPACRCCNSSRGNKPYEDFLEFRKAELVAYEAYLIGGECI